MRALARVSRLAGADRRLLARAGVLQLAVVGGLRVLSFERLQRGLAWLARDSNGPPAPPLERMVWAVEATARVLPGTTCLSQALTAQVLLQRAGYPARLRIGVSRGGQDGLEAHAWLESADRLVIGGDGHERYSPLPPLDGAPTPAGARPHESG